MIQAIAARAALPLATKAAAKVVSKVSKPRTTPDAAPSTPKAGKGSALEALTAKLTAATGGASTGAPSAGTSTSPGGAPSATGMVAPGSRMVAGVLVTPAGFESSSAPRFAALVRGLGSASAALEMAAHSLIPGIEAGQLLTYINQQQRGGF